jgi:hypothetical protein
VTDFRPARYTFVELAHADALLDHLRSTPEGRDQRHQVAIWRDVEVGKLRGLICQKCQGTGMTQWRHRSGGICFMCKGDGWTTQGRRKAQR